MPLGALLLLGNKYRVKQVGQPTSVVLGAKRNESDLLRTQISMSSTITSFTRLAVKKKKEKVVWELEANDFISNLITSNSVFINIYSSPMWLCSLEALGKNNLPKGLWERQHLPTQEVGTDSIHLAFRRRSIRGELELSLKGWIEFFQAVYQGEGIPGS